MREEGKAETSPVLVPNIRYAEGCATSTYPSANIIQAAAKIRHTSMTAVSAAWESYRVPAKLRAP